MGLRTVNGFVDSGKKDIKGNAIMQPVFAENGGTTCRLKNSTGIDTNSFGYQRAIDTLTYIKSQITEQKFYRVNVADYMPVVVGDGAFSQDILTNVTISSSGDFEEGNINQGSNNAQLASADVGVSSITAPVITWAKTISYTLIEIEQALQANNWDLIKSKHDARKENFDLGIQQIAFLGSLNNNGNVPGLLNQPNVNINSTLITATLSQMSYTTFTTVIAGLVEAYRGNCNRSAYPTHFLIPEDDFNGMTVPYSSQFPVISQIKYMTDSFAALGMGGIKIMPTAYAIPVNNTAYGLNKHIYTFLNYDPRSVRMDIPVMITATQPNTLNNFQFQDAAFAQYTGLWAYRLLEMLYFEASF
jgi:hypothetical protein